MSETLFDKDIGALDYDGAWVSPYTVRFEDEVIQIAFQAFENEDVSALQKELYFFAMNKFQEIVLIAKNVLENREGVKIRTLFFNRFGSYGFLCDYDYDEHGIAIMFTGKNLQPQIGEQDILI